MNGDWSTIAALAAATAVITTTVAYAKIATRLRLFLARRRRPFWFNLAACHVCGSFWGSGVAAAIYRPRLTDGWGPADWAVSWMAIWCAAALIGRHVKVAYVGDAKPITTGGTA